MAKFRYRMQSILEIKKKLEEQAKNEFAAARAALNEEEDKLEQLKKRKEAYEDEGRALRENTLNIMDIIENKEALLRMDEFIADQQLNVKRAQDRMEEARLALQTAMQESKTQEKLREKAFEQFVKEENARESKEIDELVSYTYGRQESIGESILSSEVGDVMTPEEAKAEKQRLKEEKKQLKKEQKDQKKAARARAKEIASQEADLADEEETGSGSVFLVTFIIVLIWIAILCLVVKLDLGGFGSNVLTPVLKDVPVVNLILPKNSDTEVPADDSQSYGGYSSLQEAVDYIKELELELERAKSANTENTDRRFPS